ncbi:guanylate kinase [Propionibacterium sp. oral taxon 192 str. F0372]|uniref:guanylate kinase n=1 Tax=Propionibacterium sp. oral taxon 192 TaxID=671222 RepID=UPI0003541F55|nr:guanylate kinase [Propionibacterium sp. oral taxon 192]EPH02773.1 guanylate kinase [Propionibacterium sp. oral taxon 192 str. F0372]
MGVLVVSGPTAVGKGTVVSALRAAHPEVAVSVSATTRAPRPGEVNGQHYFFVTDEQFDQLVADDGLLEWALVHGTHRYGTPRQPVVDALARQHPVVLEIDLQGARQVRETMPDAQQVFLAPPSWDELVSRLRGRGTETEEQMARRLRTARQELAAQSEFDVTVVNDTVEHSVEQLVHLLGL